MKVNLEDDLSGLVIITSMLFLFLLSFSYVMYDDSKRQCRKELLLNKPDYIVEQINSICN